MNFPGFIRRTGTPMGGAARSTRLGARGKIAGLFLAALAADGASRAAVIQDAEPILVQYCYDCHGDGMDKGGIALDELIAGGAEGQAKDLEKAWKIVRHEFMPPSDKPQPSLDERRAITQWIEQKFLGVDYQNPDPGRVTIRRLNRMEYEYTVTDLFGVEVTAEGEFSSDRAQSAMKIRDFLPPDDTAFGFDNIGDFQTLSPSLLDKYFELASLIVDRVIVKGGPKYPKQTLDREYAVTKTDEPVRTEHAIEFEVGRQGTYQVDLNFPTGGWREYGGAYEVTVAANDILLARDEIEVGGQVVNKYSAEVELAAGKHRLSLATVALKPDSEGELVHLEVRPKALLTGPIGAGIYEYPESHRRIFFDGEAPEDPAARKIYARQILQRLADRAFRRPADSAILDALAGIAMNAETFEDGIGQALVGILISPRFLFRAEAQPNPDDPAMVHPLDDYSLASRLSYLLWLSLPDEELMSLAAQGELRNNLEGQVERMLKDPKSSRFFEDFPGQWLRTRNVLMTAISRDDDLDPVRGAMKRETEMLFEHIARNDRDLIELITADYTFANEELAEYYGIEEVNGRDFQKVSLPADSNRGGILTHGSFLVSTSNPNRTSPVKRGLFILENLLGTQPPPPPPDVPPLEEPPRRFGRSRERVSIVKQLAAHRENKACAACHAHFDPFGIVLEKFDTLGRWQEDQEEFVETTATGETLSGLGDLRNLIAGRKDKFYRCVTEKLMTYALGRGLEPSDTPMVDGIADRLMAEGGRFPTLLMAVIESPAFQMRRGDDGKIRMAQGVAIPEPPPPEERRPRRRFRPQQDDDDRNERRQQEAEVSKAVALPEAKESDRKDEE